MLVVVVLVLMVLMPTVVACERRVAMTVQMAASISSMSTAQKDCNMASPSKAHN